MMKSYRTNPIGSAATPLVASLLALTLSFAGLWWLARPSAGSPRQDSELIVYCAAAVQPAVGPILEKFESQHSIRTLMQVGPSGALEAQLQLSDTGDLFIPAASDPYLNRLQREGVASEVIPVAHLRLVLAFPGEDRIQALTLCELIDSGVAYGICNDQAAAGLLTRQTLEGVGMWERVTRESTASMMTVTELAGAVRDGGRLRAGVVWSTTAEQFGLQSVDPPELADATASIAVGLLASSRNPALARRLADYLAAPGGGRELLIQRGYLLDASP